MGRPISTRQAGARAAEARCCALAAILLPAMLAACAGPDVTITGPQSGMNCIDDSPACVAERQAALKALKASPNLAWVKEPATARAYASGVRLFALKSKKKELSCDELQHARREADGAAPALRQTSGGLTPAQVSRSVMLAAEISRELATEYNRRCKKG